MMDYVQRVLSEEGGSREHLLPILLRLQKENNYLPEEALKQLAKALDIRLSEIIGVASFYTQFRLKPAGRHRVKICVGTACHVKGAESIYHAIKKYLRIPDEEDTDADKLFTIEKAACLGCCMLAPVIQIDSSIYGFLNTQKIKPVFREFLQQDKKRTRRNLPTGTQERVPEGIIRICLCSSCQAAGSMDVYRALLDEIGMNGYEAAVKVVGCRGVSFKAPFIEIVTSGESSFFYGNLESHDVRKILESHFKPNGLPAKLFNGFTALVEKNILGQEADIFKHLSFNPETGPESGFSGSQTHVVLEGSGRLDPLDLDAYRKAGGFSALRTTMESGDPERFLQKLVKSGLRGRGGAGFPTGEKWRLLAVSDGREKYFICNGDEGDPGAFMDRMIIESFPFRVLEGILIACYVLKIAKAFIYIRAEYEQAVQKMKQAISLLEQNNLAGRKIMGSGFSLSLIVIEGAGAFVCGEETALIKSIEGRRGMPEIRPPYPSESGLWGKPTLVNNVETMALIPWIVNHDIDDFTRMGTEKSRGTKTFALAGKIKRGGLIEVPMGITLRQIVEEIGGGIQEDKKIKAVQIGGPSGGCLPANLLDTPVDFDSLEIHGAVMGSGGLIVLDESDCMVDLARYFLSFTQQESCGKCLYCRTGTKRMLELLEDFCRGEAEQEDMETLRRLAVSVQERSLCGLGRTAPNPVLSTLRYFPEEYEAHTRGICPAGKCRDLIYYDIDDNCIGCTRCSQFCPVEAIPFNPYKKHVINREKCIRCDTCRRVCPSDAVRIRGKNDG
ncbi:MAG: NAD(P)H-dependent oxidoreductase subunit E [Spirochaetales bacterium]|nr:NAD(P)H-dependent oxidoreductase subunit E [Spirochaetales bacterium]